MGKFIHCLPQGLVFSLMRKRTLARTHNTRIVKVMGLHPIFTSNSKQLDRLRSGDEFCSLFNLLAIVDARVMALDD